MTLFSSPLPFAGYTATPWVSWLWISWSIAGIIASAGLSNPCACNGKRQASTCLRDAMSEGTRSQIQGRVRWKDHRRYCSRQRIRLRWQRAWPPKTLRHGNLDREEAGLPKHPVSSASEREACLTLTPLILAATCQSLKDQVASSLAQAAHLVLVNSLPSSPPYLAKVDIGGEFLLVRIRAEIRPAAKRPEPEARQADDDDVEDSDRQATRTADLEPGWRSDVQGRSASYGRAGTGELRRVQPFVPYVQEQERTKDDQMAET